MSGNQQFIIALIVGFPAAMAAIGGFIISIVTLTRQSHIKEKIEENRVETQQAAISIQKSVNGVQDKLVEAAKIQGAAEERERLMSNQERG